MSQTEEWLWYGDYAHAVEHIAFWPKLDWYFERRIDSKGFTVTYLIGK